jgi:DNA-binding MarR family transcriptional regulator
VEEESLPDLLGSVARAMRHRQREGLGHLGVTPSLARAVGVLRRHGTMRAGDLAAHLRIVPRSATEVVDDLEERGLVTRSPDPADRRATLVSLTEAGETTAAQIRAAQSAAGAELFGALGEVDRAELGRILRLLRGTT